MVVAWIWMGLFSGVGPVGLQAQPSFCKHLRRNADVLFVQAIRWSNKAGKAKLSCRKRGAGYKAITLYRAYLVSRCRSQALVHARLGMLSQACAKQGESACRSYQRFLQRCDKERSCRRSRLFRSKRIPSLLPFPIREAFTDNDKDGFRSCLKTQIRCSKQAAIVVEPQTGRGSSATCDCDDNDLTVRPGGQERCDGKDNDCDGKIDEPAELLPPFCRRQKGVCRGARKVCGGTRGWLPCDVGAYRKISTAYEPTETRCDGQDNDCDGKVDNSLNAPSCRLQKGVCRGAKKICRGTQGWQDCIDNDYKRHNKLYEIEEQRCDGQDNNCDGRVDNIDNPPLCSLRFGVCRGAKKTCQGKLGWQECSTEQLRRHSTLFEPREKLCDGKDNDCDGRVDPQCIPVYPWIIAGAGATVLGIGITARVLNTHNPEVIAGQTIPSRPDVAGVRGWLGFADSFTVIGSLAAATGLALGVGFAIRSLRERLRPSLSTQTRIQSSMKASTPLPVCAPRCSSVTLFSQSQGD